MRKRLILAIAILALPGIAGAQSMAEAAAKAKERKKGQPTGKVFTDDDLHKAGQGGTANVQTGAQAPAVAASPEQAAAGPAGAKPKTDDELRAEQEQAWREKLKKAQEEAQRLAETQTKLQNNLNDLTGNIYGAQRTTLMNQLDKTKSDLAATQQQIDSLLEEGRRNRYRS